MQSSIFWLTGIAFFAVQAAMLLHLLRARRSPASAGDEGRRVEIVWTLVPAAVLAALALMTTGLTRGPGTQPRAGRSEIAARGSAAADVHLIHVDDGATAPGPEAR
ncbi:MAG TPA: cytochrome c oxidase subunit II transmembrane domain-containing protein [Candidatus Binatia bacterium]|nr:cytochrome c oxidase subunit II transmembrane domain-containing protein [Candidatus Binatia bacterium]